MTDEKSILKPVYGVYYNIPYSVDDINKEAERLDKELQDELEHDLLVYGSSFTRVTCENGVTKCERVAPSEINIEQLKKHFGSK